ncbi:MAG TPA: MBL fold metallo-hydrolase [Mycobacteriales bacterium]|jgi:glyoxylase-like metal-dependent hydrolase (beta-lactamase superfamily II)|nr:MBL fold metallo-hydrolase [Mycobacteriales bacterium]
MRVGDIRLDPVSDGTFVARPSYFGDTAGAHPDFFDRHGAVWLPIGCFLIRTGERVVLLDAGLGPEMQQLPDGMHLVGGQLPTGLRALDVAPSDITDVVCTHLHADHVGWLFNLDGRPTFPNATIRFGAGDWRHFVTGPGEMADHIRVGLQETMAPVQTLDEDCTVAPGITALLAPGHTPGHLCLVLSSGTERALLLGDAITCPVQLDEPTWHSMGDVDPALADRTRERLWRELEDEHSIGVGAHFPELRYGRVLPGTARRWLT